MAEPESVGAARASEPPERISLVGPTSVAIWGIWIVLLGFVLYFARSVALPIAVAALVSLVLGPVVRALERLRVPPPLGAGIVLLGLLGLLGYGGVALSGPAADWLERAPASVREVERKLRFVSGAVAQMSESTEEIQRAAGMGGTEAAPTVVVRAQTLSEILFQTQGFVVGLLVTTVLLYFFLATPDDFLERLLGLAPRLEDKKRLVAAVRAIQGEVSRYLLTITAINLGLGTLVAIALLALGVPNAALWGVLAAVANYVPYVGAIVFGVLLGGVGILTFDEPVRMVLPAATFAVLHLFESNFFTPYVVGRRLTMSPATVFVWVMLWSWLWGVPGGLLAVPMLAALKIALLHVPTLAPYGRLIG